jgi:hypothetical protein
VKIVKSSHHVDLIIQNQVQQIQLRAPFTYLL